MQGNATEPQGGDFHDFQLLPKLSEWAVLSSVPFPKLRESLLVVKPASTEPSTRKSAT